MPRFYTLEQTSGNENRWVVNQADMNEAVARNRWAVLCPNNVSFNSRIQFRWMNGIAPPGLPLTSVGAPTAATRLCEHCGQGEGAHALGTDFCPREGGGWLQDVYSYRDPSYSEDGLDSVCQVCNQRRGQHGTAVAEYQMCRPRGVPGLSNFEPYSPALRRRRNRPELECTQPVVNGTFSTEPKPKVLLADMPHLSDLANAINKLAGELYRTTGRKQPLKALVLERDMALSMGIEDGVEVHTATGPVTLKYDKPLAAPTAPMFGVERSAAPPQTRTWNTPYRFVRPSLADLGLGLGLLRGQRAEQVFIDEPLPVNRGNPSAFLPDPDDLP